MDDRLLILNYSNEYASQLAIKLRAERIDCSIVPGGIALEDLLAMRPLGVVLAGALSGEVPKDMDGRIAGAGLPIMAMGDAALGMAQLLRATLGEKQALHAVETVRMMPSPLTGEQAQSDRFLHTVRPMALPDELVPLALLEGDEVIGFMHRTLPIYGFTFQIEQNDPDGLNLLMRFALDVCGCSAWFTDSAFISRAREEVAALGGNARAVCAMTGGLNSGVAAVLAHREMGDRLHGIFVDTGLLREREAEDFFYYYQDTLGMNIIRVNAQDRFTQALAGKLDLEEKSRIIHGLYQQILEETAAALPHDAVISGFSAQDSLDPDRPSTPLILTDKPVLRPLRELFKEEIRHIGEALGMPQEIYLGQPFPGTGLGLRILGEVTRQRLAILRKADAIFREEVREAGLHKRLWKFFCVLYPMVHEAADDLAIALRAVTTSMAGGTVRAQPARLPYDLQERCADRILQAFPEVRRVVNDITPGKSYSEVEWR